MGETPLLHAIALSHRATALLLIPHSDVNAADNQGYTPLMKAAQIGELDLIDALCAAGATVDARRASGDSALSLSRDAKVIQSLAKLRASAVREPILDTTRLKALHLALRSAAGRSFG